MGNFNNFSFELIPPKDSIDSITDISSENTINIIRYIAENGKNYTDTTTLSIDIFHKFDIPVEISKELINKILQVRNICSNWMNRYSTIDFINGKEILNDTIPQSLDELKEKVFWTCSRYFDIVSHIFIETNQEVLRGLIYYVVEFCILYSKSDGTGDWDYYSNIVTKNFNFVENQNQINK